MHEKVYIILLKKWLVVQTLTMSTFYQDIELWIWTQENVFFNRASNFS